jgi:hypothetical protein
MAYLYTIQVPYPTRTMVRSILSLGVAAALSALCAVDATTIAVMELGKGGVVHNTSAAASPTTSTGGVMSFWRSTHDADSNGKTRDYRTAQFPGMTIVPDLFSRADGGVVIGITGAVDLASMPTVASIMAEDGAVAVGHFHVDGKNGRKLMRHLSAPMIEADQFSDAVESKAKAVISEDGNKLMSVSVNVENQESAAAVDASLARVLKSLAAQAEKAGTTIVVHLVVDVHGEDNAAARRRLNEEDANGDDAAYVIPGYYDSNNNFVTPYRTIYQIQYYNVVLWTAVGLFVVLLSANLMTMNMPLMPDTLLFGESAKMVAE